MMLDFINNPIGMIGEQRFTVISTFSGCGGSSLGYMWAGGKVLLAIEWDDNAVETYRLNFPDTPVYHGDIAKLSVDEVLQRTGLKSGELDILDGSPPCQGFSTAGKRQLDDDRNQLFREYVRLLRGLKPKVFVMENVSGMVKGKMKLIFAEVMKELKSSGYRVSCRLMNTMYFGVPQSRQRLIFIGVRDDLEIEPSHPAAQGKPVSIDDALKSMQKDYKKPQKYSPVRYGDKIADRKKPIGTITKLSRWFADDKDEFSLAAYQRLGSYPDEFSFTDDSSGKARIGNSVPPRFMMCIANHIFDNILRTRAEAG